jgi:glutamyl-tRNA synthetase
MPLKHPYRGRLAPSPTGYLHTGHARTFWTVQRRAEAAGGALVLRIEDLDPSRSRPEFVEAMLEDLRWFGFRWQEGPDVGGPCAPYSQSERLDFYRAGFEKLRSQGRVYPCHCSRQDVLRALQAPHAGEEEPLYPGTCRPQKTGSARCADRTPRKQNNTQAARFAGCGVPTNRPPSWRFQVADGEVIEFEDGGRGPQRFVAGRDFGDFVVWRHDDVPSYQLAVTLDDAAMRISEVVRGEDLLLSTARQLLLYRALGLDEPAFYHCPLLTDRAGRRLAKREDALSLRALRRRGLEPEWIRRQWPESPMCRS